MERSRVLIVEDDGLLREMYRLALDRAGFEVLEAADGTAATETLAGDPEIGLVLLDMVLPDVDGLDVLRMIRHTHHDPAVPVIVVTGVDDLEHRLEGFAHGANDYIVKPIALGELVARVTSQFRTKDHWKGRLASLTDSRQGMARTLSTIEPSDSASRAFDVVMQAASAIPDVGGAAFVLDDRSMHVAASTGRIDLATGTRCPDDTALEIRTAAADPGPTRWTDEDTARTENFVVLPFTVDTEPVGHLVLAPTAELSTERQQRLWAAGTDLASLAQSAVGTALGDERKRRDVEDLIADLAFQTVFQPIVDLTTGDVHGFEALTRFDDGTRPDLAFAAAERIGMRTELERATALAATDRGRQLPDGTYLSINLSAESALDTTLLRELVAIDRPVIIEITEHGAVDDYDALSAALDSIRGVAQIAVDDAGAGYAGLNHIRALRPDIVKLDRALVSRIDTDPVGKAMVAGMVHFAAETGSRLVGEGIETDAERATLLELGVALGQGYLLGRPEPIDTLSVSVCVNRSEARPRTGHRPPEARSRAFHRGPRPRPGRG